MNRRIFLENCAGALGGLAIVGSTPQSMFAVRRPAFALHEESIWSMGTQVRLSTRRDAYRPRVFASAFEAVRTVAAALTVHESDSELSRLNDNPGSWREASSSLMMVSSAALEYGNLSGGALDVTVLPVLRQLGFAPGGSSKSRSSKEVVDYTKLRVRDGAVMLDAGGYAVDFGGIAKGYAVDEAVAVLADARIGPALLDAGGDLYALGRPEPDRRWRIGVRDPFNPDTLFAVMDVEDEAVATSGTYAQTRVIDGVKVSHIIDPKTGTPVNHVVSATVVARTTMQADALATAISVLQPSESIALAGALPDTEVLIVRADGRIEMSTGLKSRVRIL